jgi:hypothetical protein
MPLGTRLGGYRRCGWNAVFRRPGRSGPGGSRAEPLLWGAFMEKGRLLEPRSPSGQNARLRGGIEKETEGVTLVSTRQSPRQFPLRPYTQWELWGPLSRTDQRLATANGVRRRTDRRCCPQEWTALQGYGAEFRSATLVCARHRSRQFPLRPYTEWRRFHAPQVPGNSHCAPTAPGNSHCAPTAPGNSHCAPTGPGGSRAEPLLRGAFREKVDYSNLNRRSDRMPVYGGELRRKPRV